MKYVDIRGLPPCSFSPQCLRLIDDLDIPAVASTPARLAYIEDLQDERQLRQLRSHVPGCPTCSALLAEARRLRTQQRMMLYHFLVANERQVPSTSGVIFEAIRREKTENEANAAQRVQARTRGRMLIPPVQSATPASSPVPFHPRPFQQRRLFQNFLTLATVAVVILAAVGLLNRVTNPPVSGTAANPSTHLPQKQPTQPFSAVNNDGWSSVVIGLTLLSATGMIKSLTFYNYDTASSQMADLLSSTQTFADVNMEGISSDGLSLLYDETSTSQQKTYATYATAAKSHSVYRLSAHQGGNAIWMDTNHILVQNINGMVLELDAHTGVTQHSWAIEAGKLTFYHQPFLYFTGAKNLTAGALYRVDLAQNNATPQRITNSSPNTRFWLSIDGTTVFYANQGSSGVQGIYAVGSDGRNFRLLRSGLGVPIGYADDNALMVLEQTKSKLQVVRMGVTPDAPEHVVFSDAAPGATSLCGPTGQVEIIAVCDRNVALAPYGHGLLLHAYYANGSHSLVYDDLDTGSSRTILSLPANSNVQLPGWSKISASQATTTAYSDQTVRLCA